MQNRKRRKKGKRKGKEKKTGEGTNSGKKIDFSFFFFKYNNTKNSQPHNINHIYLNIHYNLLNKKKLL